MSQSIRLPFFFVRAGAASPPKNSTSGHLSLSSVLAQKDPHFCLLTIAIITSLTLPTLMTEKVNLPFYVLDSVLFSISIKEAYVL